MHGFNDSRLTLSFLKPAEACLFGCDHIQTGQQREARGLQDSSAQRRSVLNENRALKTPPWAAQLSWSRCVRERAGYVCQCVREQRGQLFNLSSIGFQINWCKRMKSSVGAWLCTNLKKSDNVSRLGKALSSTLHPKAKVCHFSMLKNMFSSYPAQCANTHTQLKQVTCMWTFTLWLCGTFKTLPTSISDSVWRGTTCLLLMFLWNHKNMKKTI